MTRLAPSWQEVTDCLPTDRYQAARVQPKATLAKHLEEFEELWEWITNQWQMEFDTYALAPKPPPLSLLRL